MMPVSESCYAAVSGALGGPFTATHLERISAIRANILGTPEFDAWIRAHKVFRLPG